MLQAQPLEQRIPAEGRGKMCPVSDSQPTVNQTAINNPGSVLKTLPLFINRKGL